MAGSYGHLVNDDLQYIGQKLLENGGDVTEAIEQLYGMTCWLASRAAIRTGRTYAEMIDDAVANWQTGIALTGDARKYGTATLPLARK